MQQRQGRYCDRTYFQKVNEKAVQDQKCFIAVFSVLPQYSDVASCLAPFQKFPNMDVTRISQGPCCKGAGGGGTKGTNLSAHPTSAPPTSLCLLHGVLGDALLQGGHCFTWLQASLGYLLLFCLFFVFSLIFRHRQQHSTVPLPCGSVPALYNLSCWFLPLRPPPLCCFLPPPDLLISRFLHVLLFPITGHPPSFPYHSALHCHLFHVS